MNKVFSIILVAIIANYGDLAAKQKSDFIRLHGTIESQGVQLNLSVATKEQDAIRATISNSDKSIVLQLIHNEEGFFSRSRTPDSKATTRKLSGDEAAGNLMDLLSLNPDYHFRTVNGFNLEPMTSEGYTFEFKRSKTEIEGTEIYPPVHLRLFRDENNRNKLIRSIEFIDFHPHTYPYLQPKTLKFTDETSGETGYIKINKVEYNPGLPDFLFDIEIPDSTANGSPSSGVGD